jgi:type I restriction enzyme S subunit
MVNGRNKYRIKDIFDLSAGGDVDKEHFSAYKTSEHRYPIYSNSLENHGLYGYTSNPKYSADSVTITGRGSVGHAEYREDEFDAIIRLLVLKPKSSNVCAQFVADYINNCVDFSLESTGVPQLTAPQIMNVELELPQYDEQKEVTTVLADVSSLIDMLGKQISKKKAIKQGTMQELLTGNRRLPGFFGEWVNTKIGSITEVYSGGTPNTSEPAFWGGKIPWMNSGELNLKIVRQVQGRITEVGMDSSSTHFIPAECVLIGLAGQGKTRGTAAFNTFPLCTNQSIAAIYPNPNKFDSKFLYYKMDTQYDQLRELSSGDGGRGGLNKKLILDYEVVIPQSIDEQAAIATILTEMDYEIENLEMKLTKYRQVKQGMMQQLLTGKIRLV